MNLFTYPVLIYTRDSNSVGLVMIFTLCFQLPILEAYGTINFDIVERGDWSIAICCIFWRPFAVSCFVMVLFNDSLSP